MPKNFKLTGKLKWRGAAINEPRVVMRAVIAALLVANLAAAVMAFKPFGGSAGDLRRQQQALTAKLKQLQARLATTGRLVDKVQTAREQGDQFLTKYVLDKTTMSSAVQSELNRIATEAGIKAGPAQYSFEPVEGSDTLSMMTIQAGFEGSYASVTKLVNLLDKSPRFLIIENMQAAAPQGQGQAAGAQALNVTLKIDTFVKETPEAAS